VQIVYQDENKRYGDRGANTVDFDICVRRISGNKMYWRI